jgi:hypothetical protein
MAMKRTSAAILMALFLQNVGQAQETERAVIKLEASIRPIGKSTTITIYPAQVVRVLAQGSSTSLIEPRNAWEAQKGAKISNSYLLKPNDFKPVHSWSGEKEFLVSVGDYEQYYKVNNDGSFVTHPPTDSKKFKMIMGKLYSAGNIVWARINSEPEIREERLFLILPDQSFCPSFYSPCKAGRNNI